MGGQSKRRGTFEERKALAIANNEKIRQQLSELPKDHKAHDLVKKHGINKLRIAMIMASISNLSKL